MFRVFGKCLHLIARFAMGDRGVIRRLRESPGALADLLEWCWAAGRVSQSADVGGCARGSI